MQRVPGSVPGMHRRASKLVPQVFFPAQGKMPAHFVASAAMLAAASLVAAEVDLVWPFGLGTVASGSLAGQGGTTVTMQFPQFPISPPASASYDKLTVKVQCTSGCWAFGPCLVVSTSQGGSSRECGSEVKTISDDMPVSFSSEETYVLTVSNTAHTDAITYSITIEQVCSSTGLPVDANACFPVLPGP